MVDSQYLKISYCVYACFLSLLIQPCVFAAPKSTPAKIAVASSYTKTVTTQSEATIKPAAKKTTPSKIRVSAVMLPDSSKHNSDITTAALKPSVDKEPIRSITDRRMTSSKVAVNGSAITTGNKAVKAQAAPTVNITGTVAQAPLPEITASPKQNSGKSKKPTIFKPYKEGAAIVVVNSDIPTGNEFGVDLMHTGSADEIVIADADEETQEPNNAALQKFLSTPSKTPAAAIAQHNNKNISQQAFDLEASAVLVVNQDSGEVLYSKNAQDTVPIASISKLMTAMVVLDAKQSMNEKILITNADVDRLKNTSSRLSVGTTLTRKELLHLALMSSENRAAHALARHYPGGEKALVLAMNKKAKSLGLTQTHYVEPTGLSAQNRSSPRDLVWLVKTAYNYPLIRKYSTASSKKIAVGKNKINYKNSNKLIGNDNWTIGLQKTGYIREAGYCMVAQTSIAGKRYIMVFLNADERTSRVTDAEKVRTIITNEHSRYASSDTGKSIRR